jgi:hypothetical protein
LISFQSVFALPLVFKKEVRVPDAQKTIVGSSVYYELAVFDSTKYKQMRVAVRNYTSIENDIYFDAVEGTDSLFIGFFKLSSEKGSGSILIDSPPTKLRIAAYRRSFYTIYIWAQ